MGTFCAHSGSIQREQTKALFDHAVCLITLATKRVPHRFVFLARHSLARELFSTAITLSPSSSAESDYRFAVAHDGLPTGKHEADRYTGSAQIPFVFKLEQNLLDRLVNTDAGGIDSKLRVLRNFIGV